jgi:hypothetical protein
MATRITDAAMTSDQTPHSAQAAPGGGWTVTWLPGRTLTRDQAITAMTIAEVVATRAGDLADTANRLWLHIDGWAAELGITGPEAVAKSSLSPEDHAGMPEVVTAAFDSQPGRRGYLLGLDDATGMARVRISGETVTMPGAHLRYAGGAPVQGDEDAPAGRSALIAVMTADERATVLAYIAGQAPGVFDGVLADWSPTFAAELAARVEAAK